MKKTKAARFFAAVLALIMILSLLPASAFAEADIKEIAAAKTLGGTVTVRGVVTCTYGGGLFIQDSTDAIFVKCSSLPTDISRGATVSVTGTMSTYAGEDSISNASVTKTSGMTLTAQSTTISAVGGFSNGRYVKLCDLEVESVSGANIVLKDSGDNRITLNNNAAYTLTPGQKLDVSAAVVSEGSGKYLMNSSEAEISIINNNGEGNANKGSTSGSGITAQEGSIGDRTAQMLSEISGGESIIIYSSYGAAAAGREIYAEGEKVGIAPVQAGVAASMVFYGENAAVFSVINKGEGKFSFRTGSSYLSLTANGAQYLVSEDQTTVFTLEPCEGSFRIVSDMAEGLSLEYRGGYFTASDGSNTGSTLFRLCKVSGADAQAPAAPTANVEPGEVRKNTRLILSAEEGARIYYKACGYVSDEFGAEKCVVPDEYTEYTGELTINKDTTYITYAIKNGLKSEEAVFDYAVKQASAVIGGTYVIFYEANSKNGYSVGEEKNMTMKAVGAEVSEGIAYTENGARVFTVDNDGTYTWFVSGGRYLTADDNENLFLSDELTDYALWTLTEQNGSYLVTNKAARDDGEEMSICYYNNIFYVRKFKPASTPLYEMDFFPVSEDATIIDDVVSAPCVTITGKDVRHITEDYKGTFTIDDVAGKPESVALYYKSAQGEAVSAEFTEKENGTYGFTVTADKLDVTGEDFTLEVVVINEAGQRYVARKTVQNLDTPYIISKTPDDGELTGDDNRPVIEIKVKNMGEAPLISVYINGERIEFPKYGYDTEEEGTVGVIRYQSETAFSDGRVSVRLCVQREDGQQTTESYSFTIGSNPNIHFYGQLNAHTEKSGGTGTIDDAIKYVNALPEESNVDFISITDSAESFDIGAQANKTEALNSAAESSIESRQAWQEYTGKAAKNNYDQNDKVALTGLDLQWSNGESITVYNSNGVVSTRNSRLSTTGGYAGLNELYKLLEDEASADTVSQFNAGSFNSFDYYSETVDERIALIEVGTAGGRIDGELFDNYILALDRGWHLSPVISQENMNGCWGDRNESRDVIITTNFSYNGLLKSMAANSVYTTEDKNLEVNFAATIDRTDYPMGSAVKANGSDVRLRVDAIDPDSTDRIVKIELIANNGEVIKTWNDPQGEVSETVEGGKYSYYLVRVTEQDGDVALTSPIWTEDTVRMGIASMSCTTAYPVTGEEVKIVFSPFTEEEGETELPSIKLKVDGEQVKEIRNLQPITSSSSHSFSFTYTPTEARETTFEIEMTCVYGGKEYVRRRSITVNVADSDRLVYIGVDNSHNNALCESNSDIFADMALEQDVRLVYVETGGELIEALANPKYTAFIFSAPINEKNSESQEDNKYLEEELNAIRAFNEAGGALIVTGAGDGRDIEDKYQIAQMQNSLLTAVNSGLRLSDNTAIDKYHNGGAEDKLYASSYNFSSFLTKGIVTDSNHLNDYSKDGANTQFYEQLNGSSVYEVDAGGLILPSVSEDVTPVVYALPSAEASDKDGDGMESAKYVYNNYDALLIMAAEKVSGKGIVLVAGGSFVDNSALRAADSGMKQLSNTTIAKNLINELNPEEITSISAVDRQTKGGYKYTIEGVVTSNSYSYSEATGFADCLYIQDSTGGICCVGLNGSYKLGDKLRISGTNARVNGEAVMKVNNVELVSSGNEIQPKTIKATEAFANTGSLVTYEGYVTEIVTDNDGLVTDIIAKDSTDQKLRIKIDKNITPGKSIKSLQKGASITVTGIMSFDNTYNYDQGGPFSRIRVRDRDDIQCSIHSHSYGWEDTVEPTCTVDGYRTGKCSCGETKIEEIKAIGHDWSEWVTTRKATTYTSGTKQRVCSKCSAIEFQKIPATKNPSTGDGDMILVWILFADISIAAASSFAVYAKKRKNGMI